MTMGKLKANGRDAVIIGAGPAGLAAAACLKARGLDVVILEKSNAVGSVWRRHYDRLHLHTDRGHSALPGVPMPPSYGRYPSRAQVVEYLERYAVGFDLKPRFNAQVSQVRRSGALWRADARDETVEAPVAVIATGLADFPYSPTWPGMETFGGQVLHSSRYRNPKPFAASACSSSASAIRAAKSPWISRRPGSSDALGPRPSSNPTARIARPAYPDLGDRPAAHSGTYRRRAERGDHSSCRRLDRTAWYDARREGTPQDGRGGWPRAAHRRRHCRCNPRRPDQGSWRHREFRAEDNRFRALAAGTLRRRHSCDRLSPGSSPTAP